MKLNDVLIRLVGGRVPDCPNEADVLAYYENKLPESSRVRFERHFAGCDDCLEVLAFLGRESDETTPPLTEEALSEQTGRVLALIREDERKRAKPAAKARAAGGFYVSYPKLASVGLVICAIAITGVLMFTGGQSPADAAMDAIRLAVKDGRYTPARVSGGLEYSSYAVTRGGDSKDDDLNFSRALVKLASAEQENASVSDRLMLARVYLARGTREDAKRAAAILNQLAARGVETPEALNDTGVAQFLLDNYNEAIDYFSKALAKSPSYSEALFNRALAEERAHRDSDAVRDWRQFIDQSSDENWKTEARKNLSSLATSNR